MTSKRTADKPPPLAGICTFDEAQRPGLSVDECVCRLKRYHYSLKRLHRVFNDRIPSEPVYELKMAFSLHSHYCAEHVTALRQRIGEMREPPLGLEAVPDEHLEILFDEILAAPTTAELLLGVYDIILPSLRDSLQHHLTETNPLADHPSVRVIRFALLEIDEMIALGQATLDALVDTAQREAAEGWLGLLRHSLANAGTLDGTAEPTQHAIKRQHSANPYRYDGTPRRDERFPDPYNMGVNAEVFLYDEQFPPDAKTLMMFYKRLREIDVPEMMSSIIAETPGKPWSYYRDMTRQLWDEARHAMMGEVGFINLGIDWPAKVMVNHTWSLALNAQLTPMERHAVLYFIEQGLMHKTGKRFEWEVALQSSNPPACFRITTGPTRYSTPASAGTGICPDSTPPRLRSNTATNAGPASSWTGTNTAGRAKPSTATGGPTCTAPPANRGGSSRIPRSFNSAPPTRRFVPI